MSVTDERNYLKTYLKDVFPNRPDNQIDNIIDEVTNGMPNEPLEIMLEQIVDILADNNDDAEEGAVGFDLAHAMLDDGFECLLNMFPDICPSYLQTFCASKCSDLNMESVIEEFSKGEYPKKKIEAEEISNSLKLMLPNADPEYLEEQAVILSTKTSREIEGFLQLAIEKSDYPTMQEYLKRKKVIDKLSAYTDHFTFEAFTSAIRDPIAFFSDPDYKSVLTEDIGEEDMEYAVKVLQNKYCYLRCKTINQVLKMSHKNLIKASTILDSMLKQFRTPRELQDLPACKNEPLLKELAFICNKKGLKLYMKMKNDAYKLARDEAEKFNLLEECKCCCDDSLIPEECYFCNKGCIFCKDCIRRGCEVQMGYGAIRFPCLNICDGEFTLTTLQMVMNEYIFEKLAAKVQAAEIKEAQVDGVEICPFCDFSMIPAEGDKIFKCQNIDCMKETCRRCKHEAHIPYGCDEIEFDEDIKKRTYIENKMSEALLRKCWKCARQFYKESGCNKMTCLCGAKMCYNCGAAVNDYNHFNQTTCPLYTDDLNKYHEYRIRQSVQQAKQELGIDGVTSKLKIDPSQDLDNYFQHLPFAQA